MQRDGTHGAPECLAPPAGFHRLQGNPGQTAIVAPGLGPNWATTTGLSELCSGGLLFETRAGSQSILRSYYAFAACSGLVFALGSRVLEREQSRLAATRQLDRRRRQTDPF